jgi:prephenate dehydratase
MQNFELLKAVGVTGMPVVLKRGLAATIEEWLMAAEYLMAHGTDNVILCERGIRTFETYTRNTLDLSAIPVIKKLSHLPVIVDPSHGTGIRGKVAPMGLAAVAAGADGIMVEVHTDPDKALSDGPQSLYPAQFEKLMRDIEALTPVVGKSMERVPLIEIAAEADDISIEEKKGAENSAAFQGVRGAYSEKAVNTFFQAGIKPVPKNSFRDVFEAVLGGEVRYGVIPVENSLAGTINENLDLLQRYPDIRVIGEQQVRIVHNLIGLGGTPLEQVRKVYSHPQGLAQCTAFLDRYPQMERVPFFDTAGAVSKVAEMQDPSCAAIAGAPAAAYYHLDILKAGIETNPSNYTRFYILAREGYSSGNVDNREPNHAVMVFATPDEPGALFRCLKILAERGLNMKKLESRPIHGKPWEYMFFIETEIPGQEAYQQAVRELKEVSENFRTLGEFYSDR